MTTSGIQRIAPRALGAEVADHVRSAVLGGHISPGSPLREVDLAVALGVSRGSVREGLAHLVSEGLLQSGWHQGTRVIEVTHNDVDEVYELRAALDRAAAVSASAVATSTQLARLDELVDEMEAALAGTADKARLVVLDMAFHDAVYDASGNRRLVSAWRAVRSQVHLFQLSRVTLDLADYRGRVVDEHRELARLIRAGDRLTLATIAASHVDTARAALMRDLPAEPHRD